MATAAAPTEQATAGDLPPIQNPAEDSADEDDAPKSAGKKKKKKPKKKKTKAIPPETVPERPKLDILRCGWGYDGDPSDQDGACGAADAVIRLPPQPATSGTRSSAATSPPPYPRSTVPARGATNGSSP
ncbi:hypothetical protein CcaverHIS002_0208700 [Cutaneotrichosporon cavernicola]|nr:hypothetical protein CcaverHIS002_0208700 [Cutaneotrichosporon cavernicola]